MKTNYQIIEFEKGSYINIKQLNQMDIYIANIKAYLITALYNAPNTISHYFTAEVNHDMYGSD